MWFGSWFTSVLQEQLSDAQRERTRAEEDLDSLKKHLAKREEEHEQEV